MRTSVWDKTTRFNSPRSRRGMALKSLFKRPLSKGYIEQCKNTGTLVDTHTQNSSNLKTNRVTWELMAMSHAPSSSQMEDACAWFSAFAVLGLLR